MKLTVLGSAGTHPGPGRMCSSYLVSSDGYRLLLDCGNGSFANLQRHCDISDIDALLVSHQHPDHFADIYGIYYALRFHPSGPLRLPVHAPAGTAAFISQLMPTQGAGTFEEHCPVTEVRAGQTVAIGPLEVRLFASAHPVETVAPRIASGDRVLAYSADSGPTDALVDCARDADLFLCEATWLESFSARPPDLHLTGREAGQHAARAGAARLMLTHINPTTDPRDVAAEAAEAFDGEVLIAEDGLEIEL